MLEYLMVCYKCDTRKRVLIKEGTKYHECDCGYIYKVDPNAEPCFYIHPTTMFALQDSYDVMYMSEISYLDTPVSFLGYKVVIDYDLRKTKKKGEWLFPGEGDLPKERFVTYEDSDRSWCEYCGIGKKAEKPAIGEVKFEGLQKWDREKITYYLKRMIEK